MHCPDIGTELGSKFGMTFKGGKAQFEDPYMMDAAQYMPHTLESAWDYCAFLYHLNPAYKQAKHRIASYFLAPGIEFIGDKHGDKKEQEMLTDILIDQVNVKGECIIGGMESAAYGNTFFTHYKPFDRMLYFPKETENRIPGEWHVSMFEGLGPVKYLYKEMMYEVIDPRDAGKAIGKRRKVRLDFYDRASKDVSRFKLIRVPVHEMHLVITPMLNNTRYVRRFSEQIRQQITQGDPFYCNDMPIEFLEALSKNEDFLYHPDHIFHMKSPTINCLRNSAWGIPETLINYRQLHHLQVMRRIDEAVARDRVLPLRIMVPNLAGAGDVMLQDMLGSNVRGEIRELIANHRRDPYAIHSLPYPVTMVQAGGDAHALVQSANIEYHTNALMDAIGTPVELYKGTVEIQNMPSAFRLFESQHQFYYYSFNKVIRWTADAIQDVRGAARMQTRLSRSQMADQLEDRGIYMQLMAGGQLSYERGMGSVNVQDPMEEFKKRTAEDLERMKLQQDAQKQYEQQQQQGALQDAPQQPGAAPTAGYGNAPGAGGAGPGATPLDIEQKAAELAESWVQIQDKGERAKAMASVRATDPSLEAYAQRKLEQMRSAGASQGRKSVGQPQQ